MDTTKKEKFTLDKEVERVLEQMSSMSIGSDGYKTAVENLKVLCEARGIRSPKSLSTDVIVGAVANLASILLILHYEKLNVITSKAIGLAFGRGNR